MDILKSNFYRLTTLLFFILLTNSFALVNVTADNPFFQYTGRIDFTDATQPKIFWAGSYIRINFDGPIVFVQLDDQTGQSYYNVFIDDDFSNPKLIDCQAGAHNYLVSAALSDTIHSILIFRRTESSTGPTKFLGIQINDGKTVYEPLPKPQRKILFYGNSITCGMGNEAPDASADDNLYYENNFMSYSAITARNLNAEYMAISKSGIGVMISWFNFVMADYFYRLNPDDANSNYDFNLFVPDVVVINLLQNDSWLIGNLVPVPDSSQRVQAYMDFVRLIRSHHQNAFIVCALGSMDATKIGSPWPGYITEAVYNLEILDGDTLLGTHFFPFDPAWTKHPRVRHHQKMADSLTAYINTKMGWLTDVENQNLNFTPVQFDISQNYPNPFNPVTTIEYFINEPGNVKIIVYDILGRQVTTLLDDFVNTGKHKITYNANGFTSGVYYYQIVTGKNVKTKSMVLLK